MCYSLKGILGVGAALQNAHEGHRDHSSFQGQLDLGSKPNQNPL